MLNKVYLILHPPERNPPISYITTKTVKFDPSLRINPPQHLETTNQKVLHRLTILWAFCESGLGGMMHAMKLPFTGFFVGGFALIILVLMGNFSSKPFKDILQACLIVLLVKLAVSPHSPFPAYIAVSFQGLFAALFFSLKRNFKMAAIFLGVTTMLESATQKLIVLTLIFGEGLWDSINQFIEAVLKDFQLTPSISYAGLIIGIYLFIYAIWGVFLAFWTVNFSKNIQSVAAEIAPLYHQQELPDSETVGSKKSVIQRFIPLFFTLTLCSCFFWWDGSSYKALYLIARTIAGLLLFYQVLNPVLLFVIKSLLKKNQNKHAAAVNQIIASLPELKRQWQFTTSLPATKKSTLGKFQWQVASFIALSLFYDQEFQ